GGNVRGFAGLHAVTLCFAHVGSGTVSAMTRREKGGASAAAVAATGREKESPAYAGLSVRTRLRRSRLHHPVHAAVTVRHRGLLLVLRRLADHGLGGEQQ